ncbi:UNVERIFIED_CONTAM: hypothetical protein PYX00_007122 [Menopon gallinae]|uniref:Beclin-1 n=1 Tax=Menopon gallinae TaxID=328185 RepID=A0AAW2HHL3_9NEOP
MTEMKSSVNFVCQRCLQPLKLDQSFNHLGEHTLAELSLPVFTNPEVDLELQLASLDHFVPAFRLTESKTGSNGFTLVDEKGETETLSHQLQLTANLFDVMSCNSYVDHPLCEECTDALLDLMDQQLRLTEEELNDYSNFLRKIENDDDFENYEGLEKELESLKLEEEKLISELKELQEEERKAKELLHQEEQEKERLDKEQDKYWREYSHHKHDLMLAEDESKSLESQYLYTQYQLEKLKKTNVFNATFHIWHSGGHFGTINNFRLGRLPSAPVEWSEINAAWGQTALLLNALARKINLTFQRYRLVPYGNHSYIEVLEDHKELPLYGSGGFRYLWDHKFDAAMVAFLDCLQQFKEKMERGNSQFCLPYRMERGRIEDSATETSLSIKIQFNTEEQWTKALKFLLTNLKWALAWVSSQFTGSESEITSQQ